MLDEDTSTGTELTASARRSIGLARESARKLGHEHIDSADLLLGLLTEGQGIAAVALAQLEVRAAGVRAAIAASPLLRVTGEERFFSDDLAEALRHAGRLSLRDDRGVTTGHLLLGLVSTAGGPGARVLAALGVTPEMVATVVPRVIADHEEGPTLSAAVARAELPGDPDRRLPGRGAVAARVGLTVVVAAGLGIVIAASAPTPTDAVATGVAMAVCAAAQAVVSGIVLALVPSLAARRFARQRPLLAPEFLPALLRGRGIRHFQLLAQTGAQRRNRCLRLGRRAWLVLAPSTIRRPLALGFVLGHEAAHLARNDTLRRRVDLILVLTLPYGAFFAESRLGWAVALGGGAVLWVVPRWSAELAADAVGVRWAGAEAMRAWAGTIGAVPPLRRLIGLLTHPPLKLRLRLATRA